MTDEGLRLAEQSADPELADARPCSLRALGERELVQSADRNPSMGTVA